MPSGQEKYTWSPYVFVYWLLLIMYIDVISKYGYGSLMILDNTDKEGECKALVIVYCLINVIKWINTYK